MSEEKLCVFCKHFYFDLGSPGYSDVTPGSDAEIGCEKGKWEMPNYGDLETYRGYIITAEDCEDYIFDIE